MSEIRPRPILEVWRELQRARQSSMSVEPVDLLKMRAAVAALGPAAGIEPLRDFMRRAKAGKAERDRLTHAGKTKPVRKRAPGAGRPLALTSRQIKDGIRLLRKQERMKVDAACELLRKHGIRASRTVLNDRIIKPAYS